MVYTVNQSTAVVLAKLAVAPRIGALGLQFSVGWNETIDRGKGFFDSEWGVPESWDQVILQGPHIYVATPFYKTPNPTMLHKLDWSATDFEALPLDAIPATSYKPRGDQTKYDAAYTQWRLRGGTASPARAWYRVAWRSMWAEGNERSLIPAIIPPGAAHVHAVGSAALPFQADLTELVVVAGFMASLLVDAALRVVPKSTIPPSTLERLPAVPRTALRDEILLRVLRLNVVTHAYADLWHACYTEQFAIDHWVADTSRRPTVELSAVDPSWTPMTPLRTGLDRRQALVELDALVALSLGVSADELCAIYRTQFPVLYGYDHRTNYYDANGRLVPSSVLVVWRKKGTSITLEERTAVHPGSGVAYEYVLPFGVIDREVDMRAAYLAFESRLATRRSNSA
jgi:hypothetical protein